MWEGFVDRRSWLPRDLRAYHRGLLLRLLTEQGPLTRRDLSEITGLSVPTVASIVAELCTAGNLLETAPPADGPVTRGPRAGMLDLAQHSLTVLGVDVCASGLRLGLCDLSGVVSELSIVDAPQPRTAGQLLSLAVEAARPLVAVAGDRLLGIGVAVPGPVDRQGRQSLLALPLGWRDVPVAEHFEAAFGVPAVVEYNVRAMAVAEARHGLGLHAENLLHVHLGKSLGIAFVVDGRPFHQGAHGVSELGHQRVVERGRRCSCGEDGCLESVLGEDYLRQRMRDAAARSLVLAEQAGHEQPVLGLLDTAVRDGDGEAATILDDVVTHLSTAIGTSVNLLSPATVALGGDLTTAPPEVLDRIVGATRAKVSQVVRDTVRIERSTLGRYPGVLGAGTVALDRLFYRDQEPSTAPRPAAPRARRRAVPAGRGNGSAALGSRPRS
jgi:predicted NBD/HSP70 family sugar kinase